jgi:tape measure domain-containing protein
MSGSLGKLSIELEARLAKFESDFGRAARIAEKEMARMRNQITAQLQKSQKQFEGYAQSVRRSLAGAFGGVTLLAVARNLKTVSDGYANITARVKLAAGANADLAKSINRVLDMANKTYASFDNSSRLIKRTTDALKGNGKSAADNFNTAIKLTEVFNKALAVNGSSAGEAAAATLQFSQAIASGKLGGDEFKSVLENNSRFATLLADSLGTTVGGLYKLRVEGKLTIDALLGVLNHTKELDEEFKTIPLTIARASTLLGNAWESYIGQASQASGAGELIAKSIRFIAQNLELMLTAILAVSVALVRNLVMSGIGSAVTAFKVFQTQAALSSLSMWQFALNTKTATSAMTVMAVSVRGLGAGMLALVGGPIGALILGLTGVAYAIYSSIEAEKARELEVQNTIESTAHAAESLDRLAESYANLGSAPTPPLAETMVALSDASDQYTTATDAVYAARKRLSDLESQNVSAMASGGMAVRVATSELEESRAEVERLTEAQDKLRAGIVEVSMATLNQFAPALQEARQGLMDFFATTDGDAPAALLRLGDSISNVFMRAGEIRDADKKFRELMSGIRDDSVKTEEKAKNLGKTLTQLAQARADEAIATAKQAGQSPATLAAMEAELKAWVNNVAAIEKNKTAKSDLAKEQRLADQAAASIAASMERLNEAIARQSGEVGPAAKALADYTIEVMNYQKEGANLINQGVALAIVQEKVRDAVIAAGAAFAYQSKEVAKANEKAARIASIRREAPTKLLASMKAEQKLVLMNAQARYILAAAMSAEKDMLAALEKARKGGAKISEEEAKAKLEEARATGIMTAEMEALNDIISDFAGETEFESLIRKIEEVEVALKSAFNREEDVKKLQTALGELKHQLVVGVVGSSQQALSSMQSMTKEGSKAYKAMEIASQALNVVLAISAVLNQGKGDPWTAFARMAAMAAAVSGLVGSIGAFGGPSGSSAAARQEVQGTGTVLGDADAKSESMVNALEITADATSQLVGINRGMLTALRAMQSGIGSASASVAQIEFGEVTLSEGAGMNSILNPFGAHTLGGSWVSSIFGGGQDLIDQGIRIQGGSFGGVSRDPRASAYQTIETDGGWFGSDSTDDELQALGERATTQIQLILESIGNAVREGAIALGLDAEEVAAAIEAFQIEEIRISTMDLSGEEAQQQLEAAFSAIFDGLAGEIVPFIAQFQRVGEGLGETLVRVATGVQVTQEAIRRLGFSLEETAPEAFAQVSESLIEMLGGIEEFINGMNDFIQNFAPDDHQFGIIESDLTRAFEAVGLSVPTTREAMWELMQSLDATTESGREQIATLLRLAGTADAYYAFLERGAEDAADAAEEAADAAADALQAQRDYAESLQEIRTNMRIELAQLSGQPIFSEFVQSLAEVRKWESEATNQLNEMARAAGRAGASEEDLALVHQLAAVRAAAAIKKLRAAALSLIGQLYGPNADQSLSLDQTESQLDAVDETASSMFEEWQRALEDIKGFLDSILLDEALTTLTPQQQLAEAQRQFDVALAAAQGGDANAAAALPELARELLDNARAFWSSGDQYDAIFNAVMAGLRGLGMPSGLGPAVPAGGDPGAAEQAAEDAAAAAEEIRAQRLMMAAELAGYLRDLAQSLGVSVFEMAEDLGLNLTSFVTDLGVDLSIIGTQTATQLADIANMLGIELTDLANELTVSLGELRDMNSVMNDALEAAIGEQPEEIRNQLAPLLTAVEQATSDADANEAIAALEEAVNAIGGDTAFALAPFLENVDAPAVDEQLVLLNSMNEESARQGLTLIQISRWLDLIAHTLDPNATIPGYAVGSSGIPSDQIAQVHAGEKIIDARTSAMLDRYGIRVEPTESKDDAAIKTLLAQILAATKEGVDVDKKMPAKIATELALARGATGRTGK